MFRHVLSWVRSTRIYFLFPLDNSIKFHKIVGWTILFFASVHTLAHIVNFSEYFDSIFVNTYGSTTLYRSCITETWQPSLVAVLLLCKHWAWLGVWHSWTHWCLLDHNPADHSHVFIESGQEEGIL